MADTTREELQHTCVSIQVKTRLTDKGWKNQFGNEGGLYGLIQSEITKAQEQLLDELDNLELDFEQGAKVGKFIEAKRKKLKEGKS